MKSVYEEMLAYFKSASKATLKEDLQFLDSQEKTDVLASDYVNLLTKKLEEVPVMKRGVKKNIECPADSNNYLAEELYLAA